MKAIAHRAFDHDQIGRVEKGQFEFDSKYLRTLRGLSFVEIHETKPKVEAVETKPNPSIAQHKAGRPKMK